MATHDRCGTCNESTKGQEVIVDTDGTIHHMWAEECDGE